MTTDDRVLGVVVRGALLAFFVWTVRGELVPVALAAVAAALLRPVAARLERAGGRVAKSAPIAVTIGALVLGVAPLALVAGKVAVSTNAFLSSGLGGALDRVGDFVATRTRGASSVLGVDPERVRGALAALLQRAGGVVATVAGSFATALPGQIVSLFLFAVSLYYLVRDGPALVGLVVLLSPFRDEDTDALLASVRDTLHGAVLGQLATSLVQGTLTTIALAALGVPGALLFGVLATALSILPMVGTTPVTVGAVVYLFADGHPGKAVVMAVAAVIIGLSDNVVRPFVQASRGGLHPLLGLLAIFGGLDVFGPAGVFLGPVVAVLAQWIVTTRATMERRRRDAG
jgi:predicted PurR-regulated permease PerM